MHELLLSAAVPSTQHQQLLRIFAGVAAMPPTPLTERHLLFKPLRAPPARAAAGTGQVGGSQDVAAVKRRAAAREEASELWVIKLVQVLAHGDVAEGAGGEKWEMRFDDVPDAVRRKVTARFVERAVVDEGDAVAFVEGLGYRYLNQYILAGHRFVHNNLGLFLHQILVSPSTSSDASIPEASGVPLPSPDSFVSLDESGAYILTSSCLVSDGTNPELMDRGVKALTGFRDMMRGVVDLRPVERLALDTRVR